MERRHRDLEEREIAREKEVAKAIAFREREGDYRSSASLYGRYLGILHLRYVEGKWEAYWTEDDSDLADY